jgi:hypothetical protein
VSRDILSDHPVELSFLHGLEVCRGGVCVRLAYLPAALRRGCLSCRVCSLCSS